MPSIESIVHKILALLLWTVLALCAIRAAHDFHGYVDRTIHVTVDDSEANIAYSLATDGRYGFPASPTLVGVERLDGQFNYGPWYFYLASAVVWFFGFSLTAVRAIHLWVVLGAILLAAKWFDGRPRALAASLFGFGLLYCFEASQWPMARPDSLVSAFAIGLVMCAGLGFRQMRPVYWLGAALMAVCGAFTHLSAASLMPAAAALFVLASAIHLWQERGPRQIRAVRNSAIGFLAGGALGLLMFYGSFGFDIAKQLRFLAAYRSFTAYSDSFNTALGHHLEYAFGYLSPGARLVVWLTLAAGWIVSALSLRDRGEPGREARAAVLPPAMIWTAYLLSNGFYTNYHKGYAILHQVMFLWLAAALLWVSLRWIQRRSAAASSVLLVIASGVMLFYGGGLLQWQASGASPKQLHIDDWVPFSEYSSRVMAGIPARATAWGSIVYGLEAPRRVQLVQWVEGVSLLERVAPERREPLIPEFVVFGYSEVRDNMLSVLRGKPTLLSKTISPMPDVRLRPVSLVSGIPYGVTRTYARSDGSRGVLMPPSVSVFDAENQQWLTNIGAAVPATFASSVPIEIRIGYEADPPPSVPTNTVMADLPPNHYLLKVAILPGSGAVTRQMLTALAPRMLRQTISEMGASGDFAAYLGTDTEVYLLASHPGGPLYVSQFDDGAGAAISAVEVFPVLSTRDLAGRGVANHAMPPLGAWSTTPGITATGEGGMLHVHGDVTLNGYQLLSPPISAMRGHHFVLRVPMRVDHGKSCIGILSGDESRWLVAPDTPSDTPRAGLRFVMDGTRKFRVAVTNCKSVQDNQASEFTVWPGSYTEEIGGSTYADRLVAEALHPGQLANVEPADLSVRTVPGDLEVTKAQVAAELAPLSPAEFTYVAGAAKFAGNRWTITGPAQGAYSYLLQSKERRFAATDRLILQGRVENGGVSIGLQQRNQWVAQLAVLEPGDFTVVIAPPARGAYSVVVANNLPNGLATSIAISKFGVLSK